MAPSIRTLRRRFPGLLLEIPDPTRFRRIALERYNQALREQRAHAQRIRRENARENIIANARTVSLLYFIMNKLRFFSRFSHLFNRTFNKQG